MASTPEDSAHHIPPDLEGGPNSTKQKGERAEPTEAESDKETHIHLTIEYHTKEETVG
ncbi:hypothetical protein L195_g012458 [Trifolium pratense]|uniref:Uncharacterized protein n=1 Tax=Trifolium pratense TaxID=57577 RepID=A0A2K3PKG6_TRIPR|nr:hypothetical protein L195_g012458 [Trifolium pratense]